MRHAPHATGNFIKQEAALLLTIHKQQNTGFNGTLLFHSGTCTDISIYLGRIGL